MAPVQIPDTPAPLLCEGAISGCPDRAVAAISGQRRSGGIRSLKIALVDPSLFTLPYDARLADALAGLGHSITLYGRALAPDETAPREARFHPHFYLGAAAGTWRRWPRPIGKLAKGVSHLRSMRHLVSALRAERPDIIHFQWLPLPIVDRNFLGALREIAPLILTAHDSRPFNANPTSFVQMLGAISVFPRFDRVIVHTEEAQRRLIDYGVKPGRLARIAHGFLHEAQRRTSATEPAPRDGSIEFLLLGKIKPYKGADVAIEAVRRLAPADRQRCSLRIVGKPYIDVRPLVAAAADLGDRVRFELRFVSDEDLPGQFERSDVLIFPYREIDMSGVLMTGLHAGRPIVASAIGGFAELLEHDRTALLVPPGDSDALAGAMSRLIREPSTRHRLATGVRSLAAAIPSWDRIAAETAALYTEARLARGFA